MATEDVALADGQLAGRSSGSCSPPSSSRSSWGCSSSDPRFAGWIGREEERTPLPPSGCRRGAAARPLSRPLSPGSGSVPEPRAAAPQVGELSVVLRDRQRGGVGRVGVVGAVEPGEQLGAGGVPERVAARAVDRVDGRQPGRRAVRARRPPTARLSRTTGVSCTVSSTSYQDTTAAQSVSRRRSAPGRGRRRWRPARRTGRAGRGCGAGPRPTSTTPSAIRSRSHRPRSWSASSTGAPSASMPGGAPGVLQQHQGEQARAPTARPASARRSSRAEPDRLVDQRRAAGRRPRWRA